MTDMIFKCLECHLANRIPVFHLDTIGDIYECPKCRAIYKTIELIQPHIIHMIPILKHLKTGKITTLHPTFFAVNPNNPIDVKHYFEILNRHRIQNEE